jgi:SAM-dependent methyltransferase
MRDRPGYDAFSDMSESRGPLADEFASQILTTTGPWLSHPETDLDVLDVGSGYGGTSIALSRRCRSVVGCEPAGMLYDRSVAALKEEPHGDVVFRNIGVDLLDDEERFDLIVLDNVYEHLPDHRSALRTVYRALRPGGVLFLLTPNKLWPIEAHYRLPGLAWLPLGLADRYLRLTGRGTSYEDASYAPTYWQLRAALKQHDWTFDFVLPGDRSATLVGSPAHYRVGMEMLDRFPGLWAISKALLVVARKPTAQVGSIQPE